MDSKKTVPVKNIDPLLADVRHPNINYERIARAKLVNLSRPKIKRKRNSTVTIKLIGGAVFLTVGVLAIFIATGALETRKTISETSSAIASNLSESIKALSGFEPDVASEYLVKNAEEIRALDAEINRSQGKMLMGAIGSIIPAFKGASSLLSQVALLNVDLYKLSKIFADVKQSGFTYFQNDGAVLIKKLSDARGAIKSIIENTKTIKNSTASLKKTSSLFSNLDKIVGDQYMAHSAELYQVQGFLDGFIALLEKNNTHIAVLFQNPAEIRPAGGFLGSYADITIKNGRMASLEVMDIYDPDGWVFEKIIPPKPLQRMTTDWEARDANWFFDFPTSAKTVLGFLESSRMYQERNISFNGVLAMNINVLESLLDITGPVPLPEYKLTINSGNFLNEIQREVEAGKDNKAGEPKRILKILAPIMMERLSSLSISEQKNLTERIEKHVSKKDIMIYAKDQKIQSFLKYGGIDGSIYELPNNFWGSYLAVVNANIAGGKSDAFIKETVKARIDIGTDGSALTDLVVTRKHDGAGQEDPWWRAVNQDYIQIFTNPEATLLKAKGVIVKSIGSSFDYGANGYRDNPDVLAIEKTENFLTEYNMWNMLAHGKNVFAGWFTVEAGETKDLELRYQTTNSNSSAVAKGSQYMFIFEKQSGVENELQATISAPLGYVWQETGNTVFTYEDKNPEGRTIIKLTLAESIK
ncbi:MAG: DUF4012 domain-containing protein [Patescibacteria group bacterium]